MSGLDPGSQARLFYLSILGIAVLAGMISVFRGRLGQATQSAAIWALIFVGLILAYGFRDQIGLALSTDRAERIGDDAVRLRRGLDGHFHAAVQVNGVEITFLVDTGASDVVLGPRDAEAVGIDLSRLSFTQTAETANGTVRGALVILKEIRLGDIRDRNVRAVVNEVPLAESLLGMSYLGRFASVNIRGDTMTLTR
jgi:aspartyl protease family protein